MKTISLRRLAALACIAFAASCSSDPDDSSRSDADSRTLARVGDRTVTLGEFRRWVSATPGAERRLARAGGARAEVESLVELMLIEDEVRRLELASVEKWRRALDEIQLRAERQQRELQKRILFEHLESSVAIDDARLTALYEETRGSRITSRIHLRQILVDDEKSARDAHARVARGESFETVARAVSTSNETRERGGDLGPMLRNEVPAELRIAAFSMTEAGEVSEPFPIGGQWSFLQLVSRDPAVQIPFEQARDDLERQVRAREAQTSFQALITEARASHEIEIDADLLANLGPEEPRRTASRANRPKTGDQPAPRSIDAAEGGPTPRTLMLDH